MWAAPLSMVYCTTTRWAHCPLMKYTHCGQTCSPFWQAENTSKGALERTLPWAKLQHRTYCHQYVGKIFILLPILCCFFFFSLVFLVFVGCCEFWWWVHPILHVNCWQKWTLAITKYWLQRSSCNSPFNFVMVRFYSSTLKAADFFYYILDSPISHVTEMGFTAPLF